MQERPVIVALDAPSFEAARDLADRLDPALCRVKVGKELFTAAGPALVEYLVRRGHSVFLDLKYHDIPNTVAAACRVAAGLGVWMVDVHASGGPAMLEAAREALEPAGAARPRLIAITVLTSLSESDLVRIGLAGPLPEAVLRLARLAHECGLDGVVSSAAEARLLRAALPRPFLLVTPGIRLPGAARDDQVRIVTPESAIDDGADFLVIGRPITQSADPLRTLAEINLSLSTLKQP
ncbi:MAG: orotidine-5'-phosphate decarboxylase [Betaproteobacteria bacterium]|nr:orotidine-5'-phosphate decarboxylase [Betaproteobacteria bacterium]MDE2622638.1 orotidine-5'-phosphate decarboxylase [Betaproteobacteria bacterium]